MADASPAGTTLRILGPLRLDQADQEEQEDREAPQLIGKPAALLCRLALAPGPVSTRAAMAGLWEEHQGNSLDQAAGKLRRFGLAVRREANALRLDLPRQAIDACRFQDGVAQVLPSSGQPLPPGTDLEVLDELLGLWRGDPRQFHSEYLHRDEWGPVIRARDRLTQAIAAGLPRESREKLNNLPAFLARFPFDKTLNVLRGPEPEGTGAGARTGPHRLLIVDDQQGDTLKSLLAGYDCTVIRSIAAWQQLVEEGPLDFDAALVDLHLTVTMADEHGKQVLTYLQENTRIPAVLMSVKPTGYSGELERKYGALGVYYKDDYERFPDIRLTVSELLRKGARRAGRQAGSAP